MTAIEERAWRHPLFGAAHAACDVHAADALTTLAGKVTRVRRLGPPAPGERATHLCACGLSADWFLLEVEPVTDDGPLERARAMAQALEEDSVRLTALLRRACGCLSSENAYDLTALLEEAHAIGITDCYDGVLDAKEKP
jgi:hypothetical protein